MTRKKARMLQVKGIGAGAAVKAVAGVAKTTIAVGAITQTTGTAMTQLMMMHP